MSLNHVTAIGRLTKDPEIRYTVGDRPIAIGHFTIAVDRKVKKGAEKKTDFLKCVALGAQAEFAEKYFQKGLKVYISGRMQTDTYQREDGVTVPTFEILIEEQGTVEFKNREDASKVRKGFCEIPEGSFDEIPYH